MLGTVRRGSVPEEPSADRNRSDVKVQTSHRSNDFRTGGDGRSTLAQAVASGGVSTDRATVHFLTEPCPTCPGFAHRVTGTALMLAAASAGAEWVGTYVCSHGGASRVSARRVP